MIARGSAAVDGTVLVLVDTPAYCDTKHEHEVRVITDGTRCYAPGHTTDAGTAWRTGTEVSLTCGQPTDDGPCDGTVTVNLTTEGIWQPTTTGAVDLLLTHGTEIDR